MTEERDKALREFIDTRHEDEIEGLTKAQAFGAGLRATWDHLWERLEIIAKTVEGLKDKRGAEFARKDETIRNRDEHISEQHYQLDIEQKVGERLQAELLAANEKILIMTEAAIHVIQLHHAELHDKDELIELLKQSRANGDVLAELVEKTDALREIVAAYDAIIIENADNTILAHELKNMAYTAHKALEEQ